MAYVRPRKRGGRLQWVLAEKEWHAGKPVEKTRASFGSDTAAAIDAQWWEIAKKLARAEKEEAEGRASKARMLRAYAAKAEEKIWEWRRKYPVAAGPTIDTLTPAALRRYLARARIFHERVREISTPPPDTPILTKLLAARTFKVPPRLIPGLVAELEQAKAARRRGGRRRLPYISTNVTIPVGRDGPACILSKVARRTGRPSHAAARDAARVRG